MGTCRVHSKERETAGAECEEPFLEPRQGPWRKGFIKLQLAALRGKGRPPNRREERAGKIRHRGWSTVRGEKKKIQRAGAGILNIAKEVRHQLGGNTDSGFPV